MVVLVLVLVVVGEEDMRWGLVLLPVLVLVVVCVLLGRSCGGGGEL
jgi:ABC-type polysaccharide/polyol phosphate export permease